MSTPNEDVDTQEAQGNEKQPLSFAEKVNQTAKTLTKDDKGNYVFPENISEEEKVAVIAERRRRDTQAAFTTTSQQVKALEAEKAALLKRFGSSTTVELPPEQAEELEELKFSDPEAWRAKLNQYESEAKQKRMSEIDEELKQVSTQTLSENETERRKQVLQDFKEANPGFSLDDDVIANDIPPRITKKLETGEISFEAFLQECHTYLKTGKVIKTEKNLGQPNLSKVGGGSEPDESAMSEDVIASYAKTVF